MKHALAIIGALAVAAQADTGLTIYNQGVAVVRETIPLDLKAGVTSVSFDQATAQVRPDSVVLRDPKKQVEFSILEQGYRNDPVSQGLLLQHFEGQTIQFEAIKGDEIHILNGKIIRSGYGGNRRQSDPVIEVDGKVQFGLSGRPLFPALGDDSILRPTLSWQIAADTAAKLDAQLSYMSRGFSWEATYNVVAPEKGEEVTLTGWVTLNNQSGTKFTDAIVKLVAGDVNVQRPVARGRNLNQISALEMTDSFAESKAVTQKSFDDFHLYGLPRPLTLRDQETKQVEFLRSDKVKAKKVYIYAPAKMRYYGGWNRNPMRSEFPKDVHTFWTFENTKENGLNVPLPAGTVRFYRSDDEDGNIEFVGENSIPHTATKEEVKVQTGVAFDLVGERKMTNFQKDRNDHWVRESIKVTVKNRSKEQKTIVVREPMWRWSNWKIENPSMKFTKVDAQTIEFSVDLAPDEVKDVTYTAHYFDQ